MGFLKRFSGLTDGRTADRGDPFCQEIRFAWGWVEPFGSVRKFSERLRAMEAPEYERYVTSSPT
jgi:hypothetical protein